MVNFKGIFSLSKRQLKFLIRTRPLFNRVSLLICSHCRHLSLLKFGKLNRQVSRGGIRIINVKIMPSLHGISNVPHLYLKKPIFYICVTINDCNCWNFLNWSYDLVESKTSNLITIYSTMNWLVIFNFWKRHCLQLEMSEDCARCLTFIKDHFKRWPPLNIFCTSTTILLCKHHDSSFLINNVLMNIFHNHSLLKHKVFTST